MARVVRGALVALVAVLVGLGGALSSTAASGIPTAVEPSEVVSPSPEPGCLQPVDSYGAPRTCQLLVKVLTPICDNEVPKLRYEVQAIGSPNTTATITFVNPGGADVVYANQPLSGTVNWPGAVVGPDGRGVDWPGWRQLADGTWVEGDEFDWVRPSVDVLFEVNPSAVVTVAYPPSSPVCLTNPPSQVEVASNTAAGGVLAITGSESGRLLLVAVTLVVVGGLALTLVTVARRRRNAVASRGD